MINPESIDLSLLPTLPLERRSDLPQVSGIYFAVDSLGIVRYVGRSNNICQRWVNHHHCKQLTALGGILIVWLEISEQSLLPEIETALIAWFKPTLNKIQSGFGRTAQSKVSIQDKDITEQVEVKPGSLLAFILKQPPEKPVKTRFTLDLNEEHREKLEILAAHTTRSKASVVKFLIDAAYAQLEAENAIS